MSASRRARTAALLILPVLAAALGGAGGVFQFDDFNVIVDNPVVHSFAAWWADAGHGIRPLLKLSYSANWAVTGPGEAGFHAINIGVHLVNTLLVFTLAKLLAFRVWALDERAAEIAALIAALLFGLHPANTEAVAYISGRSSSLMALFGLGSVLAYVAGRLRERWVLAQLVSPLLFALALLTKESVISLPLLLVAWEASRGRPRRWKEAARSLRVHALVLLLATITLLLHPIYGERLAADFGAQSLGSSALTQIKAVAYIGARLFWPWPANIDPDLRLAVAWSPMLATEAVLLFAALALGARAWWRRPWWAFGVLWFGVALLPTNSVVPRLDLANDRQLYFAGIGVCIAIGIEIALLCRRLPRLQHGLTAATVGVLALLGGLTFVRGLDYASEVRLWQQTARASPLKARAFNNLGFAYSAAGCALEAETAYREALRLNPGYALARTNLERLVAQAAPAPATTASSLACPP
ncbi:MAG: hypothetical protein ABI671_12620 [Burkholderiales bacterium]